MHACPSHHDRAPSLHVDQAADGTFLIHCHAGCEPAAILAAWGLTWGDLFPGPPPSRPRRPGPLTETGRAVVAVYARADRAAVRRQASAPAMRDADEVRAAHRVIREARQVARTLPRDAAMTWVLLAAVADLERAVWGAYGDA